jgi:hypothetical protein
VSGSTRRTTHVSGLVLLAVALPVVLVATSLPSFEPGTGEGGVLKLLPSPSDSFRNLLLFVPLGVALALLEVRRGVIVAGAALLSLGIEAIQWMIPGRESSPWDLLANAVGAWLGGWLVTHGWSLLHPADEVQARRRHRGATLLAAVLLSGGSLLFARTLPDGPYFGHVPPDLPNLARYPGTIEQVEISGDRLINGELPAARRIREQLLGDHRISVTAVAGTATPGLAGLGLVTDRDNAGVLLVGVRRDALLYAVTTFSHRFGFDGGGRWVPGVVGRAAPGSHLRVEIERRGDDVCIGVGVDSPPRCGFGFRLGEGWTHLLPSDLVPAALRPGIDVLWLSGALAWVGFFGRGRARDPVPWGIAVLASVAVVSVGATRPPSPTEFAALAIGLLAGWLVSRGARRPTNSSPRMTLE